MTAHPRLPGHLARTEDVRDVADAWPVARTSTPFSSDYLDLRVDTIVGQDGAEHDRVVVRPHGAVAVLALDEDDRVLLVQQYRHAVGMQLCELPAGTLDVAGEQAMAAAARELAEEADVHAEHWEAGSVLTASPGYSTEQWQIFRATGLRPVAADERTERTAEEAGIRQWWLPFDDAVDAALDGSLGDALSVAAILSEQVRRARS